MAACQCTDKSRRCGVVRTASHKVAAYLKPYLPLANAHMTDFIVHDWWNSMLIESIGEDLLRLKDNDLALLPSGALFAQNISTSVNILDNHEEKIHQDICSFSVVGTENLGKEKPKWDRSLLPQWQHTTVKDFVTECQQNTLPHLAVVSAIQEMVSLDETTRIIEFMSTKKSHEVEIMTELCASLARQQEINTIVDIGSGKGYLGSHLSLRHGLRVLGIDSSLSNTEGAAGRSTRLGKQWNGLVVRSEKRRDQLEGNSSPRQKTKSKDICDPDEDKAKGLFMPITQYVTKETSIPQLLTSHLYRNNMDGIPNVETISPDTPYMMGGLHACGDLSSNTLRLFLSNKEARLLCNVGCCYHHLTEAFVQCPFGKEDSLEVDETGFPLSSYLKTRDCQLGRNARMLASQAPNRIANNGKAPNQSLFWRALLQVILRDMTGELRDDWQVGKIAAKCVDFKVYVHKALEKLGLPQKLSEDEIETYEEKYKNYQRKVECFVQLKAALAPCIETLVLLDRLLFLLEHDNIRDAHIVQAFDPVKSPRCFAIIAHKR